MSRVLKPCPFRVHGERTASLTVAGEFYYNETFMPCMGKECACFKENSIDTYCDRNGAFMTMTKEVTCENCMHCTGAAGNEHCFNCAHYYEDNFIPRRE